VEFKIIPLIFDMEVLSMKRFKFLIAITVACLWSPLSNADVIPVNPITSGTFYSADPIMTMYFQGVKPRALILFISGGWGKIGLRSNTKSLIDPFSRMLQQLNNPKKTSGKYDLVVLDTPHELYTSPQRGSSDHLSRIESVIQFYIKKTGLPIWIMGHSNGSLSMASFIHYLQEAKKVNLVSGLIISGGRNETSFSPPLLMPMLFIHHEEDACINTQPNNTFDVYKTVKEFDYADVQYVFIQSGEYELNDPCTSGYHMYFNAEDEVAEAIDSYLGKIYN
jgi:hypothetical protein